MKKLFALTLLYGASLCAAQESPWIKRPLVLIPTLKVTGEAFNKLDSNGKQIDYHARNLWIDGSLYFAPTSDLSAELGTLISKTRNHPFLIDSFYQTARYALQDDALGDPFAWTVGISFREAFRRSLHDPSAFHKGLFEVELHTSQGVEIPCDCDSEYRIYAVEAIGIGSDSPWLRAVLATEYESLTGHLLGAKIEGYLGLGTNTLNPCHFRGYGSLAYRILDASLYYRLRADDWTLYEIGLTFRPYSRNAPYQRIALDASVSF